MGGPRFGPSRDSSCCIHCGVYMEVIGPPGPTHAPGCPEASVPDTSPAITDAEVDEVFRRMGSGENVDAIFRDMFPDEDL